MVNSKSPEMRLAGLLVPAVLLICLSYGGSMTYPFHFDDRTNIVENRALRLGSAGLTDLRRFLLEQPSSARNRPVSNLTFALQVGEGVPGTLGFHTVNLLIHAVNVVLLSLLFLACLDIAVPGGGAANALCAAAGAALWGASPLHTESVTYIVQRETSLSALFSLAACLLFTKGLARRPGPVPRFGPWRIAGIAVLFLLSAGSKENGLLLPFALAALAAILPYPGKPSFAPKAAIALALGGLVLIAALGLFLTGPGALNWKVPGAAGYGPLQRVMTQPLVLLWYLSLLFLPFPGRLNLDIDFPASQGLLSPPTTLLAIVFWAVAVLLAVRWRKTHPFLALAVFWYLSLSAMESSFLNLEMAYLHRTYLPSAFLFLAGAAIVLRPRPGGAGPAQGKSGIASGLLILALVFGFSLSLTWARNRVYASPVALWTDATAKSPNKARPWFNLGRSYQETGQLDLAAQRYRDALAIDPAYFRPYANLAVILEDRGDLQGAWELMTKAYGLRPGDGEVLYNLGRYAFMRGSLEEAAGFLARSLRSKELVIRGDAYWYLALVAERRGDLEGAKSQWEKAVSEYGAGSERGREARARLERLP